MKNLQLGIIGSGFIAQFQTNSLRFVRNVEVKGIVSRSGGESLRNYIKENNLGEGALYTSIEEMANHVDVIAVYTPNFATVECVEKIAAARKKGARVSAIICEKPLGRNLKEATQITNAAEDAKLLTAYFENQIHMKAITSQRQQLQPQQEAMGPLSLARCAEEHAGPHKPWFWDPTQQGGGVLSDMGCHSIAVGWYALTPVGQPLTYLEPVSVSCDIGLLKWGRPEWREKLLKTYGVDYLKNPAEDFATGIITFRNPDSGQLSKLQFTDSWMFDKQGLRLYMDGMGPGYAFEVNTLQSSLNVFIGDEAAEAVADGELALEKSTASRGLLAVHPNEADLYGYVDENDDAVKAFQRGEHALLPFNYGLEINRLVMASYMAAEKKQTIDLTDPKIATELEGFVPLVQQGRGAEILY